MKTSLRQAQAKRRGGLRMSLSESLQRPSPWGPGVPAGDAELVMGKGGGLGLTLGTERKEKHIS